MRSIVLVVVVVGHRAVGTNRENVDVDAFEVDALDADQNNEGVVAGVDASVVLSVVPNTVELEPIK